MIKAAIQFLLDKYVDPKQIALSSDERSDERIAFTKPVNIIKPDLPDVLKVNTLSAVADFIASGMEDFEEGQVMIHVVDHSTVRLISDLDGDYRVREEYVEASIKIYNDPFPFGRFIEKDKFIIELMSKFQKSIVCDDILKVVGNLKSEKVRENTDDGISQTVSQKIGAGSLTEGIKIENPVFLQPYRTFRDIEVQPGSNFILRFEQDEEGSMPEIGLFEADGATWKLEAIKKIADFFKGDERTKEIKVIA